MWDIVWSLTAQCVTKFCTLLLSVWQDSVNYCGLWEKIVCVTAYSVTKYFTLQRICDEMSLRSRWQKCKLLRGVEEVMRCCGLYDDVVQVAENIHVYSFLRVSFRCDCLMYSDLNGLYFWVTLNKNCLSCFYSYVTMSRLYSVERLDAW